MDDYSFAKEDTDYSFAKPEEDYSFAQPENSIEQFKANFKMPEESSPFGARPEVRSDLVHPKTVGEAAYQAYGAPAIKTAKFVRANPAKTALAIGSLAVPEISIPLAMGSSVVATAIDKLHPFEPSVESEYTSKTGAQNLEDLLTAGVSGASGQYLANRASGFATKLGKYNSEVRMAKEDPFEYIASNDKLHDAWSATNKLKEEADPNMLHSMWIEYGSHPSMTKDILREAKKDIAARSNLPRKMSTITDREAREHLDKVISNIESTQLPNVDITPKNPMQGLADRISASGKDAVLGGLVGHALAGPVGAVIGGAGGGFAKAIADKTAQNAPKYVEPFARGLAKSAFPASVGIVNPASQYFNDRRINNK